MKKLIVNGNCIGCGMCVSLDPDHFEIVDGLSSVTSNDFLESGDLLTAIESCPVAAIEIEDDEDDEEAN